MNTRTLQITTLLVALVWVGVSSVGSYVVWDGFSSARIVNRDLNLRIHAIQEKQDEVLEGKVSFALLEEDVILLDSGLLKEGDVLNLLLKLEEFAATTGNVYEVNVIRDEYVPKTIKTKNKSAKNEVLPGSVFHIELTGNFDGLYQFLDRVQKLPYVMQVQRMNTRLGAEDDIQTSLRIKIFSRI